MLLDEIPLVGSMPNEFGLSSELLDSGLISPSHGISPQVICSEEVGSITSPLVAEVVSHAVSAALASTVAADTPSIEASFFCVEGDHARFFSTFFFEMSIVSSYFITI